MELGTYQNYTIKYIIELRLITLANVAGTRHAVGTGQEQTLTEGETMTNTSKQIVRDALLEAIAYAELKIVGFRREYPEEHVMVQTPLRLKDQLQIALQLTQN